MSIGDPFSPPPDSKTVKQSVRSRFARRPRRLRVVPFNVMIPNLLTLLSLSAGMTAMRFALEGRWEASMLAMVAAAVLDTMDGRVARLLKGSTKMGAELDSLSDVVCFGVAPAVIMYLWSLANVPRFGWVVALLFACCCALRLARFNAMLESPDKPAWSTHFFAGFPAPAAAGFSVWPLILSFIFPWEWLRDPLFVGAMMLIPAGLMVSRLPVFSLKRIRLSGGQVLPMMVFAVAAIACMISAPWWTLTAMMSTYVVSTPFAVMLHRRYRLRPGSGSGPAPGG
ncbi:MAG: CDP-alcohol phosphatidyltransferase family protein [Rhodospirillales bacterium]